jgi:hypothetical protein
MEQSVGTFADGRLAAGLDEKRKPQSPRATLLAFVRAGSATRFRRRYRFCLDARPVVVDRTAILETPRPSNRSVVVWKSADERAG